MLNAPWLNRVATCIVGCTLAIMFSPVTAAQTIDVSLNVYYDITSNVNSGGRWELVAKSTNFGISVLQIQLTGINAGAVNEGPRGNVNGSDPAGFREFDHFADNTILTLQEPAFPTGDEQGAFYGVGTLANGEPGDIGPTIISLTNPQDIPWATGDTLVVGPSVWDIAAMFASGTFSDNVTPGFAAEGHTGSVFTTLGTSTSFGQSALASITTIVRTNLSAMLPDYNHNGVVDAADYVIWRKGLPAADGNNDTFVNQLDYDLWVKHFREVVPGAGGGSLSGAVPEPASGTLLVFGLLTGICSRRRAGIERRPLAAEGRRLSG